MSCLKIQNFKKKNLPKENTQNVSLTGENLPKELLDEIKTGNVEKIVRILLTDKNIARYITNQTAIDQREKNAIGMQL